MFAGVEVFPRPGDDAPADHLADGTGDHLRVQTQILQVHALGGDGVGQRADAELDAVAVAEQTADILRHGQLLRCRLRGSYLPEGVVRLGQHGDLADVDVDPASDAGDAGVDLQNDLFVGAGAHLLEKLFLEQHAQTAHLEVAVLVHGGDGGGEYIELTALRQESGIVAQIGGDKRSISVLIALPVSGAKKVAVHIDAAIQSGGLLEGIDTVLRFDAVDVLHPAGDGVQAAQQELRAVAVAAEGDDVVGLDLRETVVQRSEFTLILFQICHDSNPILWDGAAGAGGRPHKCLPAPLLWREEKSGVTWGI